MGVKDTLISFVEAEYLMEGQQKSSIYLDRSKAHQIGNVVISTIGGATVTGITEGEQIEIPETSERKVAKVVIDSRTLWPRFLPKFLDGRQAEEQDNIKDIQDSGLSFDQIARHMIGPEVYFGHSAVSYVSKKGLGLEVVTRRVGYAARAEGSYNGVLDSSYIDLGGVSPDATMKPLLQPYRVGQIYRSGFFQLSKIVSAHTIEAHGIRWSNPDIKSPPSKRRIQQLSLKPIPVSSHHN